MLEAVLLSGAFCITLIIIAILFVFYIKKVSDYRDTFYLDEIRKLRNEVAELKHLIGTELKNQLNNLFK